MSDTYNGYANYSTWAVSLWLDNEPRSAREALELAADAMREAVPDRDYPGQTLEVAAASDAADRIERYVTEELLPDLGSSLAADLLGHSVEMVDWRELADLYIENVKEGCL